MISCHTLLGSDVIASEGEGVRFGEVAKSGRIPARHLLRTSEWANEISAGLLFSYTKKLMTSCPAGPICSPRRDRFKASSSVVCVVLENMLHGRGQSLALL